MSTIVFDGQQEGERILYELRPHPIAKYLAIARGTLLALGLVLVLLIIAFVVPSGAGTLTALGVTAGLMLIAASVWWNNKVYGQSKTYITDRRVMRFDVVSPFYQTKRSLFWNEALKAKGWAPNLLSRILGIGTVEVSPHMDQHEDVVIPNVAYFEDIANYIDKILFTSKQTPQALSDFKPFIPKPRGQRGS
ncbi:hypothetical protein HY339_03380 [Candidatus Gottesmanbacteria bacterium]|nr:hypothetical protein [Candidatus Gottesmanbacteria bacterium]